VHPVPCGLRLAPQSALRQQTHAPNTRIWHSNSVCSSGTVCLPEASSRRTASGSSLWALQCRAVRPRESMSLALAPLQQGSHIALTRQATSIAMTMVEALTEIPISHLRRLIADVVSHAIFCASSGVQS